MANIQTHIAKSEKQPPLAASLATNLEYTPELAEEMAPLYEKVRRVVPHVEWTQMAPLIKAINDLKEERNAVILAHNYMTPEIFHCISDFVGDSLQLAIEAS